MEIKITTEFNFLEEVCLINNKDKTFRLTCLEIKPDNSVLYGCLDQDGETKWFRSYEIKPIDEEHSMGIQISKE